MDAQNESAEEIAGGASPTLTSIKTVSYAAIQQTGVPMRTHRTFWIIAIILSLAILAWGTATLWASGMLYLT
jgi:hypothetical protein